MSSMFYKATVFNGDISLWKVSAVTNMKKMFYMSRSFNQKLSLWNVSAVIFMRDMFYKAQSFDQDLSAWDVSVVVDMHFMFHHANRFNQNLSAWDVSAVKDMRYMFNGACSFEQILCGVSWVNSKARKFRMFLGSRGSISSTVCSATPQTTARPPSTTTHKVAKHCLVSTTPDLTLTTTHKCSWRTLPADCDSSTCGLAFGHGKAGKVMCDCASCDPNNKPAAKQCPATPACGSSWVLVYFVSCFSRPVYFGPYSYNNYRFSTYHP